MKNYPLTHGKETWESLHHIHGFGYSYNNIFTDFLDIALYSLLSLSENCLQKDIMKKIKTNKLTGKYEDEYKKIMEKYRENKDRKIGERPADYFANAFSLLQKETYECKQDILGEIFMSQLSLGDHGQFFTPSHIGDMMAQMIMNKDSKELVSDPCVGSGRFFISASKISKNFKYVGTDISILCVKMCVLNMWMFDLEADIYHGNSLTMQMYRIWKIRKGGFIFSEEIKDQPSLPSIKEQLKSPAKRKIVKEQMKLF